MMMMMMMMMMINLKINTHIRIPWSRILLDKLTDSQLVKKFLAFYGTRSSITAFTTARHVYLSWARSIQFMPPIPYFIHVNVIFPTTPWSSTRSSGLPTKTQYTFLLYPMCLTQMGDLSQTHTRARRNMCGWLSRTLLPPSLMFVSSVWFCNHLKTFSLRPYDGREWLHSLSNTLPNRWFHFAFATLVHYVLCDCTLWGRGNSGVCHNTYDGEYSLWSTNEAEVKLNAHITQNV